LLSFIFESLGTSELILIGIVALIFLGPRRLPEVARKLGKIMNELRSTTTEFKETWEREVNFDEEVKSLHLKNLEEEVEASKHGSGDNGNPSVDVPEVKAIDASRFDNVEASPDPNASGDTADQSNNGPVEPENPEESGGDELAKQNWL